MITCCEDLDKLITPFQSGIEKPVGEFIEQSDEILSLWLELENEVHKSIQANCGKIAKLYWDEILPIALFLKSLNLSGGHTIEFIGHTKEAPDATLKNNGNVLFGIECVTADGYNDKWRTTLDPRTTQWELINKELEQKEAERDQDGIVFSKPETPIVKDSGKYEYQNDRVLFTAQVYEILKDRVTYALNSKRNMSYSNNTKLLVVISKLAHWLNMSDGKYLDQLKSDLKLPNNFSNVIIVNTANPNTYTL